MMREFLALAVAIGLGAAAHAEQGKQATIGMKDPNAPIEVTADNFDADANTKTAIYSGNVVVHQGEVRMRANAIRVNVVDGKPSKIFAQGHVVIDAPSGAATGDNGVYDVNPRLVTLTGHVVLTKEKNVMRGSLLTVNLITGKATLDGGKQQGGRVQGLFTPGPQTAEKP
ncbi:MAG: lipopolysaccharide transport periplasmic protein LptA [Rhizomicrobium sp.]|jgi:lipopolysaccharide export system protein LptA